MKGLSRTITLVHHLLIAILIWFACLAELVWSVWTDLRVCPSFLDLAMVAIALFTQSRWTVFWGGGIGLLVCVLHQQSLSVTIPLYSTVALMSALTKPLEHKRTSLTATAIRSLLILSSLHLGKQSLQTFPEIDFKSAIQIEPVAQVAFSFLLSVLICFLFVIWKRKSAWA